MSQKPTAPPPAPNTAGTTRAVVVIGLAALLVMVGALFLNTQQTPGTPGAVAAPTNSQPVTNAENCRTVPLAEAPVVTTASGLQYQALTECDGPKPVATSRVTVHYRGTLPDGTQFDSSYDRGQPATFPLNGVIAGWTEGVQLMSVGARYRFTIPGNLAYGANPPQGSGIPANSTLIFEVELLSFQ